MISHLLEMHFTFSKTKLVWTHGHSPSLSYYRCDLHILLNAVSVLLFGIINPLPLLERDEREDIKHLGTKHTM